MRGNETGLVPERHGRLGPPHTDSTYLSHWNHLVLFGALTPNQFQAAEVIKAEVSKVAPTLRELHYCVKRGGLMCNTDTGGMIFTYMLCRFPNVRNSSASL